MTDAMCSISSRVRQSHEAFKEPEMLHPAIIADESQRNAAARAYIASGPKSMLIGGGRIAAASGETFDVIDPSNGKVLSADRDRRNQRPGACPRSTKDPSSRSHG